MASDRETIAELRKAVSELQEELERIASAGLHHAVIVGKDGESLIADTGGRAMRIGNDGKSKPGDAVWVHPMTQQVVAKAPMLPVGLPATVMRVAEGAVEVHGEAGNKVIFNHLRDLKKGDRILVDQTQTIAISLIERAPRPAFAPTVSAVHWHEVGGHEEAKRLLREAVEDPRNHAEIFRKYGKKPTRGILLFGPPGTGKTLLARAVATSVWAEKGGFLAIKGPEVLDPYVGVTEQTIRGIFKQAREFTHAHKTEAVIFVDEAESLLARRGMHHNYMGQTVVPTFLTEMDGLEDCGTLVILATNRPDILDPAIVRHGRVDHKIEIKRPSEEDAATIFEIYLKNKPLASGHRADKIGLVAAEVLYSIHNKHLPHSGALIEAIVEKATSFAMVREKRREKPGGISENDVLDAIAQTRDQESAVQ